METFKKYLSSIIDCSDDSWKILSGCITEMRLAKNTPVLRESEVCNAIFFVSSGYCKSVYNRDGKLVNAAFNFENSFATNLKSLKEGTPSEYDILAGEKSVVLRLDKIKLLNAYKQSHEIESFGRKVLEIINLQQESELNSFKLLTPKERFLELTINHPDILQRVSLTQLASYLGVSRETVSRFRAIK